MVRCPGPASRTWWPRRSTRGRTSRWTRSRRCWRPTKKPGCGPMRFSGDVWVPVAAGSVGGAMTVTEKDALADVPALEQEVPVESGNFNRVLQLIAGLAVITALFILLGWGDILLFIAILIAIVMLHELGHFVTAKRAGMKVTEYFVGFGPRLWSVRRGETEYGVK